MISKGVSSEASGGRRPIGIGGAMCMQRLHGVADIGWWLLMFGLFIRDAM